MWDLNKEVNYCTTSPGSRKKLFNTWMLKIKAMRYHLKIESWYYFYEYVGETFSDHFNAENNAVDINPSNSILSKKHTTKKSSICILF